MKIHQLISAVSGVALSMAAFTAPADSSGTWHYDEDQDTIVLGFPGSRDKHITSSNTSGSGAFRDERSENWYIDDDYNVVLSFPGSRDKYVSSPSDARAETRRVEREESWYVDDDYNVVLSFPGSRDKYLSM